MERERSNTLRNTSIFMRRGIFHAAEIPARAQHPDLCGGARCGMVRPCHRAARPQSSHSVRSLFTGPPLRPIRARRPTGGMIDGGRESKSLQEKYAPENACRAADRRTRRVCASAVFRAATKWWRNETGAALRSISGVLNGGIIGTLLDCHCNWTAARHLMNKAGEDRSPCTVTADYAIKLLRPTPTDAPIFLAAKVAESTNDRATIEGNVDRGWKNLCDLPRHIRLRERRSSGLPSMVGGISERIGRSRHQKLTDASDPPSRPASRWFAGDVSNGAICHARDGHRARMEGAAQR